MTWKHNPGSPKAIANGCICPRMDNANGKGLGEGRFWISKNCNQHGIQDNATYPDSHKEESK